ncbi:putative lyase [Rickettsia parkeri str. Grand Bay]|nr:putative lyase [Rickettsia parkeri str. Grand Bay]
MEARRYVIKPVLRVVLSNDGVCCMTGCAHGIKYDIYSNSSYQNYETKA